MNRVIGRWYLRKDVGCVPYAVTLNVVDVISLCVIKL